MNTIMLCCILLFLSACPGVPRSSGTSPDSSPVYVSEKAGTLREAISGSTRAILKELDAGVSVAVISINAPDSFEGEYALEELTLMLVRTQKFRVVERRSLDIIREEQQFQLSGEVDDATAVSIGHLIGAAFVITGSISPWESEKYLRLRILDVKTGQITIMTSVSYGGDV